MQRKRKRELSRILHKDRESVEKMTSEKETYTRESLLREYDEKKSIIKSRLKDFGKMMDLSDEAIFSELVFCIFTPQSSAKKCDSAVKRLIDSGLIREGSAEDIAREIGGVRFHNTKSRHAVAARELFSENGKLEIKKKLKSFDSAFDLREWLIANVYGLGYKESSHFLRNIGLGFDLAILDRHILLNLARHGVIECVPKHLSKTTYLSIEKKMIDFSKKIGISAAELDLLFWSRQTGEVFK